MGGLVTKSQLFEYDKIKGFFKLEDENITWLYGGCIPAFNDSLKILRDHNIGMIVTLLIDPLKNGKMINYCPQKTIANPRDDTTEWLFTDKDYDLSDFTLLHIPMADGGYLTQENGYKLINEVTDYLSTNPGKNIYLHCWGGNGRTNVATVHILKNMCGYDSEKAISVIENSRSQFRVSDAQRALCEGRELKDIYYERYIPICDTPKDHKCFSAIKTNEFGL
jgi:protein-tyrosine phosphatase